MKQIVNADKGGILMIKTCFLFIVILSALLMSCSSKNPKITMDEAYKICRNQYKYFAEQRESQITLKMNPSHPISLDSFRIGAVKTIWINDSLRFLERAEKYLKNKMFWKCLCRLEDEIDTEHEIYIDANSGEVLYVDGMWAERWCHQPDEKKE